MEKSDLTYITNHLGEDRENYFNAVAPPVIQTSNFAFDSVEDLRIKLKNEMDIPLYSRGANPTVNILRKKLAALENAEDAWVFSSGSAAMSTAVIAQVKHGDHIIAVENPYSWTKNLLMVLLEKFGVTTTFIDGTKTDNFKNAIEHNTKLIILESPNSITFEMQDIKAVADLAKQHKITTIIDNSYCSPLYQSPLEMGIDIVMHTASKYLGGHADLIAGVIMSSKAHIKNIFKSEYMTLGTCISPNDAWLLLRSLRTFPLRMKQINKNTIKVISYLESHPKVLKLHYPFAKDNEQLHLAKSQMKASPGLFSIEIAAKEIPEVERFVDSLKLFLIAVSWGGYESLVFPMCAFDQSENYSDKASSRPFNMIRIAIGLDDADALIADLKNAFDSIS